PAQRFQEMAQEPPNVVVVVIDRQPGNRDAIAHELFSPLSRQRALAEARRRVNEDNSRRPPARSRSMSRLRLTSDLVGTGGRYLVAGVGGVGVATTSRRTVDGATRDAVPSTTNSSASAISSTAIPLVR